jgi:hypothetical protein
MIELQEDPLGPAHVVGVGRVYLAVPIVGEAEALELAAEIVDIVLGVDARVFAGLAGVFLGGQAEGVPAHRVEHVVALHAPVARDDVGGGVALGVPDVQSGAARVGKHVEHVELRLRGIESRLAGIRHRERFLRLPMALPLGFKFAERKALALLGHGLGWGGPGLYTRPAGMQPLFALPPEEGLNGRFRTRGETELEAAGIAALDRAGESAAAEGRRDVFLSIAEVDHFKGCLAGRTHQPSLERALAGGVREIDEELHRSGSGDAGGLAFAVVPQKVDAFHLRRLLPDAEIETGHHRGEVESDLVGLAGGFVGIAAIRSDEGDRDGGFGRVEKTGIIVPLVVPGRVRSKGISTDVVVADGDVVGARGQSHFDEGIETRSSIVISKDSKKSLFQQKQVGINAVDRRSVDRNRGGLFQGEGEDIDVCRIGSERTIGAGLVGAGDLPNPGGNGDGGGFGNARILALGKGLGAGGDRNRREDHEGEEGR